MIFHNFEKSIYWYFVIGTCYWYLLLVFGYWYLDPTFEADPIGRRLECWPLCPPLFSRGWIDIKRCLPNQNLLVGFLIDLCTV